LFDRYLQDSDAFSNKSENGTLSKAQKCFQRFLVVVNVVFLVFAIVLISVGAVAYTTQVGSLTGSTIPQGIVAIGVFIMFVSFLGCFGAWKESRTLLGIYFFFMFLFSVLLLAVGIGVSTKKEEASYYISQGWMTRANKDIWNTLQKSYSCCGLVTWNDTFGVWPCPQSSFATQQACLIPLINSFNSQYNNLAGVGISLSVLMLLTMVFVCRLIQGIKAKSRVGIETEQQNETSAT